MGNKGTKTTMGNSCGKGGGDNSKNSPKDQQETATLPNMQTPAPKERGLGEKEESSKISQREQQVKLHTQNRKAVQGRILEFDNEFTAPNYPKSAADETFLSSALGQNFIFSDISKKERKMLIKAFQKDEFKAGQIVINQGDMGDFFYICESGTIAFIADGNEVGTCSSGGSFGELSLLYDSPRAATCKATTDAKLWKVDQATFRNILARSTKDEEQGITETLSKVPLLKDLDRKLVAKFATVLTAVTFQEGEKVVIKGEQGDVFYIIKEGQVRVHDIGVGDATYSDQILKNGDWFGERALMTGEPRAANVTAMTETVAFAVDRETFETTIGSLESILGHESKKRAVSSVPIFAKSELLQIEYDHLVSHLKEVSYKKGDKLAEAGKPGDQCLWIIKEGKLMITSSDGKIFFLGSGGYFGDKDISSEPGVASAETCVCEEDSVCWVLKKADIESVIGDVKRLGKPSPMVSSALVSNIGLKDITKHRMLGMGAFGRVWLASTNDDKKIPYALKTINKRQLIQANQVKGVLREKQIMASIDHPFIVGLAAAFQDDTSLYLLLPLYQGGELFNVVHTDKRDGISNSASIFYGACILEALGHLHDRNIVYRDMKPENALIDQKGYCIMIDLGFAKIVVEKTYTLCGTPEYLAPEIIMAKGHDKAVDYWSFGVLVYEMLVGKSPFYTHGTDQVALFKRIVMVKYSCPSSVKEDAQDIIKKLLTRRQASRLGNLSRGHHDVKDHPWFKSMDWGKLLKKELRAPWIPSVKNPLDASHFEDFSREEREVDRSRPLNPKEQNLFKDF